MAAELIVHVVDDDVAVRQSLAFLLATAGFSARVHESAAAFLAAVTPKSGGCLVTDIRMPGMDGLELQRELRARGIAMPVIVITGHADVPLAVEAMRGGAVNFIEKPFDDEKLLESIRSALATQEQRRAQDTLVTTLKARIASLSERERQVLDGLVAGHPNKIIAHDLGISPRTVEIYRANLMTKMQAGSLSELVRMAMTAEAGPNPA